MPENKVLEKINSKFPSPYDSSKDVLIYKNPSNLEMQLTKSKTSFNELRGLIEVHAVYIWDANLATHNDVEKFLNIIPTARFLIEQDGSCISADENDLNFDHPMLKRMLK